MHKGVVVVLILVVITAGCVGGGSQNGNGNQESQTGGNQQGQSGNGGGGGQVSVSFSEETLDNFPDDPTQVIIKVESIGSYDFVWIEVDNVDGGFRFNRSYVGNQLFIRPNGYSSAGYICYKESVDSGCTEYAGEPSDFTNSAQVYGVEGGEKTLLEEYSPQ
jgi:hypothetical protein